MGKMGQSAGLSGSGGMNRTDRTDISGNFPAARCKTRPGSVKNSNFLKKNAIWVYSVLFHTVIIQFV
jgi:hypothetical protein